MFNNNCIIRYPCPLKVVFDNGSEIKRDSAHLIKHLGIKPVLTSVKNSQANAPVERVHQVILNMLVTRDLDNKLFDHIGLWGENLSYIAWSIRASYHHTIMATPCQAVFVRDLLSDLASVVGWQILSAVKQRQVDVDNFRENAR